MDESDEDDVRRLPGLKTVKKKKLRMGIPVWLLHSFTANMDIFW